MTFRKVTLDRVPSQGEVLTITKSGIYFSSLFIKNHNLEKKESIAFFFDDQDPYMFGFEFYDEPGSPDSLVLMSSGRMSKSIGRTIKASELIGKSKILQSLQKDPLKINRTFEIKKEKNTNIFYVLLRPAFEHKINFEKRNSLSDDLAGIYRYKNKAGEVLYIGKGQIKNRSNSSERRDWGVHEIEYSSLTTEEDSLKWESYYIQSYQNEFGLLPPLNRISGHSQDN
jgi:hypothetical protein